ncbi:NAD(P)/FAD-dependent oxidoreductase [Massilia terrae]|uniref:NAD(P)/FAD-dependent oxidoreductase n=1 Tax=Massilia terrae TaxID=1811224 RepID=A0ABT2CTL5_9BURK|nr:NAD(P)/FAD-dependent oxidoreductase [Massilia terrae]MCS0657315.1 NAD(P)/FAD-dependent oxidoreductase [Massilia terrae]
MSALPPSSDKPLLDVLIVGAGLSGIGAAVQFQRRCPGKRYAILEARDAIGGTWDLFRYPGIRSDSDMYTLGYAFKPWTAAKAIADGPAIRDYVRETAHEHGVERHIRFGQKVTAAEWSSKDACWTVVAEERAGGAKRTVRARFLYMCSGYYSYEQPWRPRFDGEDDFTGVIVHPQSWPERLDYAGKRVVVIGSGATAVTLVPALAQTAAHVTMLQRSPTFVVNRPSEYAFAARWQRILPRRLAWFATRWRLIAESMVLYRFARRYPDETRRRILSLARRDLGRDYDVERHFNPRYQPWDQRICVAPDGDLFHAIRAGQASVETDTIERFTPGGILLKSGKELDADIVVTATGLRLSVLGGAAFSVDGQPYQPGEALAYKGMMLSGLPNCAIAFGYTNASWTLKADLTSAWVCRLLRHMDRRHADIAMPRRDGAQATQPFVSFTSGYVRRAVGLLPQQGAHKPWQVYQNYLQDLLMIRFGRIADGVLRFGAKGALP